MEHPTVHLSPASEPQKRNQRFLRFELQPGDAALLDQLSDNQRAAILSEGSYEERAQKLGIPVGTLRSRLHRARASLEQLRQSQPSPQSDPNPPAH